MSDSDEPLGVEEQLAPYIQALASRQPVPGGGAASAVTLAQAAALAAMVLQYTIGKPKFIAHEQSNRTALKFLSAGQAEALALADRDADAYANLESYLRLDAAARAGQPGFLDALAEAIAAPRAIGDLAVAVADAALMLSPCTSRLLRSDLACAAELARAAAICATWNVRANLPLLTSTATRQELESWCDLRSAEADKACAAVATACR